jgi:ferritin
MLNYKSQISHQYDAGINLAIQKSDKNAANFMQTMKNQHMENLEISTNHDTAKLIATAESAPFWGGGGNCDLVLEGRVNELF